MNINISGKIGAIIGFTTFSIREGIEKILFGFDWAHFFQEIAEDCAGACVSVIIGYFVARFLNRNKEKDEPEQKPDTQRGM